MNDTNRWQSAALPLGRLLLSTIFLMSGIHKITDWTGTEKAMSNKGMVLT